MSWSNGSLKYMCRWKWMTYTPVASYADKIEILSLIWCILTGIFSENPDARF